MASPQQKKHIGPFEVESVLGRGAQGVVYLARDNRLKRFVAIKTIGLKSAEGAIDTAQFQKEAHAVAKLKHANIVPIYDIGEWQGRPYLVLEYVEGKTLADAISDRDKYSIFDLLKMCVGMLDGLAHAHAQGVIHCDIKPSNILLDNNSSVKLTDFGISRLLSDSTAELKKMQGTLRYLAPEVVTGQSVCAQSDVFSIGLVMYELLTGKPAIKAKDSAASLYEVAHGEPLRPSAQVPAIDKAIDAIVMTATNRKIADRYESVEKMKVAIERFLNKSAESEPDNDVAKGNSTTVKYLLAKIRRNTDFPAFSQHITEINRLAASDSDATVIELTNAILKDYSLTNKLLRLVNSPVYGQFGGKINTVSRAVTILGFSNIRMLAVGLLVFDQVKNRPQVKSLMEANMWCFVAAFISRQIVGKERRNDTEMTFIASLLNKLGTLLVIYYLPDEYEAITQQVEQQGLSEDEAAKSVLGVHFYQLGQLVGESWGLPTLLIDAMQPPSAKGIHKGHDSASKVLNTVGFSSSLLSTIKTVKPQDQKQHIDELLKQYKTVIDTDQKKLQKIIDSSLEQAFELIDLPVEWQEEFSASISLSRGEEVQAAPLTVTSKDLGSVGDKMQLLSGINDVTTMMMGEHSLSEILVTVLESIYRGLGLNRVVLLINNAKKQSLVVRFGFAPDLDLLKEKLAISVKADDEIGKALRNQADLLIDNVSTLPEGAKLPAWCTQALGANSFGIYPIVIKNSLIGAIYFDSLRTEKIAEEDLVHIQSLRNQAALAIKMNS